MKNSYYSIHIVQMFYYKLKKVCFAVGIIVVTLSNPTQPNPTSSNLIWPNLI